MTRRKNTKPRTDADEKATLAAFIGDRIREAMRTQGWMIGEKYDVARLAAEVGSRWQTAQEWIEGKTPPSRKYAVLIARSLGMSLEQLMGVATGQEPRSEEWRAFVESPIGRTLTRAERQSLSAIIWPHGQPDRAAYQMALAALRAAQG